ncbi:MAG: hypothetical protein Kow0080_06130 [Candidatus Promineifilaceae bacterium]
MKHQIQYNPNLKCLMVQIIGEFDLLGLEDIAMRVAKLLDKHPCKAVINDMRQAKLTNDVMAIYNMPKLAALAGIKKPLKRALVVNKKSGQYRFLETVFMNQGHAVKLFESMDEAVAWVKEQQN